MKAELSTYEAADILLKDEHANWSRGAAFALIEYYESIENECGESIELDHVAIRCAWTEYSSLKEWANSHSCVSLFDTDEHIREYIEDRGNLIEFDGGVLVQQF